MSSEEQQQQQQQIQELIQKRTVIRDESLITMDNLEDLNEDETLILLDKWKNQHFPPSRFVGFFAYNCFMCGVTMYYTINFRYYSKKFFNPTEYSFKNIVKYGTIQSTVFLSAYFLGAAFVTNFWHPIDYIKGYAKIQGRIIDNTLKFDPYVQNYVLYDMMKYFGLSPKLMDQAKEELNKSQKVLEDKNFFSSETKEMIQKSQQDYYDLQKHKEEKSLLKQSQKQN